MLRFLGRINKLRFSIFIVVSTILVSTIVYGGGKVISKNFLNNNAKEEFLSEFEVEEVIVTAGDTSWNIQEKLAPNHDTRKVLYYSEELNETNLGEIKPGTKMYFLKERD